MDWDNQHWHRSLAENEIGCVTKEALLGFLAAICAQDNHVLLGFACEPDYFVTGYPFPDHRVD
jgi:hypothetical protein